MTDTVLYRGREDKLEALAAALAPYLSGSVVDVGCDRCALRAHLPGPYVGLDAGGEPDVRCNLEEGLPLEDRSWDTAVAMDVLEHLERAHAVFDELCRVASRYVIVGLPNMYEWRFRLQYLLGGPVSGKYGLPPQPPEDRHRWLLSLGDARRFVRERGDAAGFVVERELLGYYHYRRPVPRLVSMVGVRLAPHGAGLLAYAYWAVLARTSPLRGTASST